MLGESISIWASMSSWFTPTVLFVLLNLMIGTIFITSSLATHKPNDQHQEQEKHAQAQNGHGLGYGDQLARSPSVLQRLKSINFYSYRSQEPTTLTFEKPQESDQHFTLHQQGYQYDQNQNQQPISRSPSMLQRLKSINLYNYFSQEPINPTTANYHANQETTSTHFTSQHIYDQTQELDGQLQEQEEDQEQTLEEIYSKLEGNKLSKSNSDTKPSSGEVPKKLPKKMKKSASAKSAFAHFEEGDIVESRRPATVREGKTSNEVDDTEVDAKADDFINRFKQQLKLQRMNSIMRYKEMISRRS
ncbi:hypothetical protein SADUNF_Sadunf18G0040300 [Salix dunnii]|uniref:DUF4408 domain-containing protein n=1 Tax=Salix dunnii TaxID=1413687 RepID=A0A835MIN8_9ROSI|nr:hypothetical protein SADUNF_Sadunf18G0040300 [Salix dunnii]